LLLMPRQPRRARSQERKMAEAKNERTVATKVTGDEWTKLSLAATAEGVKSVGAYMKVLIERALDDKQTKARVRKLFGIDEIEDEPKPARKVASPAQK
jgi:hypothetical protein